MIPYRVMFTRLPLAIPSDCFSKNQRSDISLDSLDLLGTSIRKVCFFCDELYGNFLCGIVKRRGFHPSNVSPMENPHPHFSLCAMEKNRGCSSTSLPRDLSQQLWGLSNFHKGSNVVQAGGVRVCVFGVFEHGDISNSKGFKMMFGGLVAIFYFPIYWECHHPKWLSYFLEGFKPPTRKWCSMILPIQWPFGGRPGTQWAGRIVFSSVLLHGHINHSRYVTNQRWGRLLDPLNLTGTADMNMFPLFQQAEIMRHRLF